MGDEAIPSTTGELAKLYKTEGHPIAFSSPGTIYKYFGGRLSKDFITKALEEVDSYTLHREYKRPKVFNPYYTYVRRQRFQADLITIANLAADNDGVKYLNLVIDTFSRKVWLMPQKDKTGKTTSTKLEAWLKSIEDDSSSRKRLLTDNGLEYRNSNCKKVFSKYNVTHDTTLNIVKASIAERANKSIQVLIYKYLTDTGSTRYMDALAGLVKTYNTRPHRSLDNHSPNFADEKENEMTIRELAMRRYADRGRAWKKKTRLAVGDRVRVKTYGVGINTARRAYLQQFKGELFTVQTLELNMAVPMYTIRSMDTEEEIEGGFYANELQRVRGDTFKIEKVIRQRGKGDNVEYLVKWQHFGPRWNSWVKKADMVIED